MSNSNSNGKILKKDKYTVEVKYSPEAEEKKLIKFTTPSGDFFEISAEEIISMLVEQVSMETLAPAFVDTQKVNVINVRRDVRVRLNEDMKKGQEIPISYFHPYPLEFALIEEAYQIAKIDTSRPAIELTKEFIDEFKKQLQPKMHDYIKKFYQTYKNIDLSKK